MFQLYKILTTLATILHTFLIIILQEGCDSTAEGEEETHHGVAKNGTVHLRGESSNM